LFGGGGAGELASRLGKAGFSTEQLQAFLPRVLEFFKGRLPDEVMQMVSGLLPVPQESAQ
jgi:hypothetical protein